jgi:type IV pilus assembly protein PilE
MMKRSQVGFTLIELMIVVGIVGILATIAFANYGDNVTSAKRTDGRTALLNNLTRLEKCKATYGAYNNPACTITANSPDNYYTVAVVSDATSFTLTATAVGSQATNDTD